MAKWWEKLLGEFNPLDPDAAIHEYNPLSPFNAVVDFAGNKLLGGNAGDVASSLIHGGLGELGDFLSDPTGRKAAAGEMADIAREQMQSGREQWEDYTRNLPTTRAREGVRDFLGRDYERGLPRPERYRSSLDMSQYYSPEAQRYRTDMRGGDYYYPKAQQYEFDPFKVESDPAYQFALKEGLGAIERRNAAGSGALGPAVSKEMAGYATGLASQHGQQAFDRWAQTQGMEYDASRAHRGDVERRIDQQYSVDTGERSFDYLTGRDYLGDIERALDRRAGLDIGQEGRDYSYSQDYYQNRVGDVLNRYNIGAGQAGMAQNILGMSNPLGYTGQQAGLSGQLMNAVGAGGGRGIWDWLNLGTNIAGAAAPFF